MPTTFATEKSRAAIARRTWRYALRLYLESGRGYIKAIQFLVGCAYAAGYSDGHEAQMKGRIRDAQECREKNGRHL